MKRLFMLSLMTPFFVGCSFEYELCSYAEDLALQLESYDQFLDVLDESLADGKITHSSFKQMYGTYRSGLWKILPAHTYHLEGSGEDLYYRMHAHATSLLEEHFAVEYKEVEECREGTVLVDGKQEYSDCVLVKYKKEIWPEGRKELVALIENLEVIKDLHYDLDRLDSGLTYFTFIRLEESVTDGKEQVNKALNNRGFAFGAKACPAKSAKVLSKILKSRKV